MRGMGINFDQKLVDTNCEPSLRTKLMTKYAERSTAWRW